MDTVETTLKGLDAGRVLDVATGPGNFIHFLVDTLHSFEEIVGIDSSEKAQASFEQAFAGKPVSFLQMDAARMDFPAASFDTACISNSLHHMSDLPAVLAEMMRILRPGGSFIVNEMVRDGQTEAQKTHVLMHHWWGAVDTAVGIHHRPTYTRRQLQALVDGLDLANLQVEETMDLSEDPRKPETVEYLHGVIEKYLERIRGLPGEASLRRRGLLLRWRVDQVGFHSATGLLILGRKRQDWTG